MWVNLTPECTPALGPSGRINYTENHIGTRRSAQICAHAGNVSPRVIASESVLPASDAFVLSKTQNANREIEFDCDSIC